MPSSRSDASSLQIFKRAKSEIINIFNEKKQLALGLQELFQGLSNDVGVESQDKTTVADYHERVDEISKVLVRNHMKVVVFGRTSNGKSSVMNAMMGDKVLPADLGHTTNCFLQVEGGDSSDAYLTVESSEEKKSLSILNDFAHALHNRSIGSGSLVRIHWPKEKCALLRDDVVLLDTPGADFDENLDNWAENYCLDADVFILVVNAESALSRTEKNLFVKVVERFSRANVFILINKWDSVVEQIASPDRIDDVRQQHLKTARDFLSELKMAEQRVFFVSSMEALLKRMNRSGAVKVTGHSDRYSEFECFEAKFKECISKTAVETKFGQHAQKGAALVADVQSVLRRVDAAAAALRDTLAREAAALRQEVKGAEEGLRETHDRLEKRVEELVKEVKGEMLGAVEAEGQRVRSLVEDFNQEFSSDKRALKVYRNNLDEHVWNALRSSLESKVNGSIKNKLTKGLQEMAQSLQELLPSSRRATPSAQVAAPATEDGLSDTNQGFSADLSFKFDFEWGWAKTLLCVSLVGLPVAAAWSVIELGYEGVKALLWDEEKRMKAFKEQYVKHLSETIRCNARKIEDEFGNKARQMLEDGLAQQRRDVEEVVAAIREEAAVLELRRDQAHAVETRAKQLTDTADQLSARLENFSQTYLQTV